MTIRPVTSRWPSSAALWQDTSLPLACVVMPYLGDDESGKHTKPRPLAGIVKCLHCGAPQASSSTTHYPRGGSAMLLCHLCGKHSSTRFDDQQSGRPKEHLVEYSETHAFNDKNDNVHLFSLPVYETTYSLPAMTCPPVWWIVVDGSIADRNYWNGIGAALRNSCRDIPSFVHVGLLVASHHSLGVWDLASAVPHVKHLPWDTNNTRRMRRLQLTPASYNLQAALRALGDMSTINGSGTDSHGMPLGATLELILETMTSTVSHPGNAQDKDIKPMYAGGRILCLLGGPPVECPSESKAFVSKQQSHGTGGHGGSCAVLGQRYSNKVKYQGVYSEDPEMGTVSTPSQVLQDMDDTDMTAKNLYRIYAKDASKYFSSLGKSCAQAGLGVDVLIVTTTTTADTSPSNVGLPFLRQLSDRSGAPGPLLCSTQNLEREVTSRTPWTDSVVFGGILRIRTSQGFSVDTTPVEGTDEDGPQLATLYCSGGLMGPASFVEEGLWIMGSCEETSAVTIDLQVQHRGHVKDRVYVDGLGEVAIKHSIQTCFAYTCVECIEDGTFVTVRRMRVESMHLPLVHDTESLYARLDPEALAVVLFHKLTIAALQDGLVCTHEIGQQWLQSLMTCAYRSAQEEEIVREEQISRGLDTMNPIFYPQERLLDREGGELSSDDVLLGQGHERLHPVPLIVFALLQCDALRPSMGSFSPTVDARCAASAQMYNMPPSALARCVAPRLELWSSGDDAQEPIMENLELSLEQVTLSVMEHSDHDESGLLLFLDSPREILVCHSRHVSDGSRQGPDKLVIGKTLERSIQGAVQSYRVPPPVVYELDSTATSTTISPSARLFDALVEDSCTLQGLQNFSQWKQDVAAIVQEAIEK